MSNEHRITLIRERLTAALAPSQLHIIDESHHHIGHAGAKTGLGHFKIHIASPQFHAKSDLAVHRMIYAALGELMKTDIHALTIEIINND